MIFDGCSGGKQNSIESEFGDLKLDWVIIS